MSEAGIVNVKFRLLELICELDENELDTIEQWICSQSYRKDLQTKKHLLNTEAKLTKIGETIKKMVPLEAEMPSENIHPPTVGDQADCNEVNTLHIDAFLYNDDAVEKLYKKGKLKKYYCLDCNSRNVKELLYISHSMSLQSLEYIFKVLLPQDLEDKQVVDIGSRIGAVIYGAYYFSNAASIVGIEMNKECCNVQEQIIDQFSIDKNRVKVIHSDVLQRPDVISQSDVVILNVLDFFVDNEKHKEMWYYFKKHIKKGSYLVCNRSMPDTLSNLDIYEEFMNWFSICRPNQLDNEIFFDMEDCNELFLYTIN